MYGRAKKPVSSHLRKSQVPKKKIKKKKVSCTEGDTIIPDAAVESTSENYPLSQKVEDLFKSKKIYLLDAREASLSSVRMSKSERRMKDKSDRACVQKVIDPTTKIVLYKLINQDLLSSVNGCISTGKEANVYHGINDENNEHFAIKIYKTVTTRFIRRSVYVKGDFRFTNRYIGQNRLKAVKVWAEKEMRNLKRIYDNGINCPEVIILKSHILVMRLIGNRNGWSAPKLKDYTPENVDEMRSLYLQAVSIMYNMFHNCKLIHADYSEYNLLVSEKKLYVIDVSQSVEPSHPLATEFLARDCFNVAKFFRTSYSPFIPDSHRLFHLITTKPEDLVSVCSTLTDATSITEVLTVCLDKLIGLVKELSADQLQKCESNEEMFCNNYTICSFYRDSSDMALLGQSFISYSGNPDLLFDNDHTSRLINGNPPASVLQGPALKSLCAQMKTLFTSGDSRVLSNINDRERSFGPQPSGASSNGCSDPAPDDECISNPYSSDTSSSVGTNYPSNDKTAKRPGKKLVHKKFIDAEIKRQHKMLVKQQKREKRAIKIPKKAKKKMQKKHLKK